MAVVYKTPATAAQQMAQQWYQLAGVQNPSPAAIAHWTKEIQQDGSHTAFLTFSNGQGQDTQSAFNPQTLVQNVKQFTTQQGFAPWQPDANTPQYDGTNTKSGGAIIGSALNSPVGKIIEGVVAGAIDVATGGAATPFTTAGLAALQGGGTAMEPGNNFGTILKAGLGGAAEGALAGGAGSLFSGATGIGAAGSSLGNTGIDLSGMSPGDMASIGDASSGAAASAANGVDLTSGLSGSALSGAANAGSGGGSMSSGLGSLFGGSGNSSSGDSSGGFNFGSLLSGLGGAANAYTNYTQSQQSAADREAQLAAEQAQFNRTQGATEGMDAASLQRVVNDGPPRDKAQALMMARLGAPPTAFQPRDITHGNTSVLNGSASGGIAPTMSAVNHAAQNYTPGAGGTSTAVDQTLINRFMNPQNTVTTIPGGNTIPNGPTYPNTPYTPPPAQPQAPSGTSANPAAPPLPLTPPVAPTNTTALSPLSPVGGGSSGGAVDPNDPDALLKQRLGMAA